VNFYQDGLRYEFIVLEHKIRHNYFYHTRILLIISILSLTYLSLEELGKKESGESKDRYKKLSGRLLH